ncbi:hypothetical protein RUM43_010923 [Polyplax serrata]|uniref:Coiled-coil domain-containing protein 86 n=1 Tax=Polyplax serrata TaxID=468196 RepID=A0AAN8NXN0_POLSC
MSTKVLKLEEILKSKKGQDENVIAPDKIVKKKVAKIKNESPIVMPKGLPVSGRVWKSEKKRFSSIIKTRGYKSANKFEKLLAVKKEINRMRELSREVVEEKKQQIEQQKERRRRNLQKKEANRLKSEIVQVIKNPAKIKRMRKKQLRKIEKRDTLDKK